MTNVTERSMGSSRWEKKIAKGKTSVRGKIAIVGNVLKRKLPLTKEARLKVAREIVEELGRARSKELKGKKKNRRNIVAALIEVERE